MGQALFDSRHSLGTAWSGSAVVAAAAQHIVEMRETIAKQLIIYQQFNYFQLEEANSQGFIFPIDDVIRLGQPEST